MSILAALVVVALGQTARVDPLAKNVLVVANAASPDSVEIARTYQRRRGLPADNLLVTPTIDANEMNRQEYDRLEAAVKAKIRSLKVPVDYIVLARGIAHRIREGGYSVDGHLVTMERPDIVAITDYRDRSQLQRSVNPYFNVDRSFRFADTKMRLVTRLDGYTNADALRLIDNSLKAKREKGLFWFESNGMDRSKGGARADLENGMILGAEGLAFRDFEVYREPTPAYGKPDKPLMGFCGWGSNDGQFDVATYKSMRFRPGAIAETFVSSGGRTFRPTTGGQSLIADLIASGVTGVKGYVSEPYTFALARPELLFARYTSGMNLAESFYGASQFVRWKDVVVGDPLCRPYR